MSAFRSDRTLLLYTSAAFCLAIVGCSSKQAATQEQRQPVQITPERSQPAPNQMPSQQVQNQPGQDQDGEVQMGQEIFNELKAKGEIIESSPLYDQLRPIADAITQAAQPRYNHPFKFYLVHETQPNAFATPGGNVYVVDSLLYFVKNREQLAGTLCHEVSHTIHHDAVELMEKREKIKEREIGAAVLMGPTRAHILAILLLGKLHSLGYSRDVESRADLTGSDICAQTGSNPWGLVWLFQDFKSATPNEIPQLLSDHPDDQNRINALEHHFRQNPSVFGRFNPDPKSATPFAVPKNAQEVFLR
jgi:predicted Zn-dependent protease